MALWGAVFLLAVAGTVLGDPLLTFPEIARGATRIVSGWEAEVGQLPFQLSLRLVSPAGAVSACGGTIISARWGLTAAHCTAGRVSVVIRAGTVNLTQPAIIFETTNYWNHPLYNEALQSVVQPNDIGVMAFERELIFSDLVQPIRLQRSSAKDENYAGVQTIASGWGRTWTQGSSPENLNWVYLSGVSNQDCLIAYGFSSIIQPSTICARGYNVTSQSTCQGDSGGPLTVIDSDGEISQIGVTSFVSGTGCHTGFPAGFIRPGYYHDWFTQVTGENFDWELEIPSTTASPVTEVTEEPEEPSTTASPVTEVTEEPEEPSTTASPVTEVTEEPEEPSTTASPVTEVTEEPSTTASPVTEVTEEPEEPSTTASPVTEVTEEPEDSEETEESSESSESESSESDTSEEN